MLKISLICAGIMAFWASVINEESAQSILSGYNTMNEEKKKNVDFKGIAKLYRTVFFFNCSCNTSHFYIELLFCKRKPVDCFTNSCFLLGITSVILLNQKI